MVQSEYKILWMVNTKKGFLVLKKVFEQASDVIALVSSYTDSRVSEDYGKLIKTYCNKNKIDYLPWQKLEDSLQKAIVEKEVTGIVAIGWQYLIPNKVYSGLPHKLIIFHDSLLPRYRGFAPVATGMINGEEEFGVSVIYAGNGIDDGDVILQKKIHLGSDIYISEAIEKICELYCDAAITLVSDLKSGTVKTKPQNEAKATYSIWRSADDCWIDWRKPAMDVYNLIRAVSHPYPGAFAYLKGKKMYVWQSEPVSGDVRFEIRDCGKIWRLEEGSPVVVCGEGLLRLTDITDEYGKNILPLTGLRQRFT